ncbi:MAG TPA: hypothetical protein VH062_33775 [Polyangiaceae bacterium]|jgi:pimeloyl-ACP methyl ester carboxylesterase|nr:hypothetical protein [Polyangiaceae bacterium]
MSTLLVLHGYTMNGSVMQDHMASLAARFPPGMRVVYPSAPLACPTDAVERFYGASAKRLPGPHLTWWDASDDGTEYRGWESARDGLHALIREHAPVGVLGFSQGAIVTTALAATAPPEIAASLGFVVLVAGRAPRATALAPHLLQPIRVPSLHVWGERDGMATVSAELVPHFDATGREVATWAGGHRVPVGGPGADAIVSFVSRHAGP